MHNPSLLVCLVALATVSCSASVNSGESAATPEATAPSVTATQATAPSVTSTQATAPSVTATQSQSEPQGTVAGSGSTLRKACEISTGTCTQKGAPCKQDSSHCSVIFSRFAPEGRPLEFDVAVTKTYRWRFREDGRLLESPTHTYRHTEGDKGIRRARRDGTEESVLFDKQGNLVEIGREVKFRYTAEGFLAGYTRTAEGKSNSVTYSWGSGGKYSIGWDYPDSAEYCDPAPDGVKLDALGRVVFENFSSCQINYPPFSIQYHYDKQSRPEAMDVQCDPESDARIYRVTLKYDC